jgi:ABC-2 type transport system permease protein
MNFNPFSAFLLRDLKIEKSYRVSIAMKILDTFFLLCIFFFVSRYFASDKYFPYVFSGIVFSKLFQFWLGVFSENIRQEQYLGTLEQLFLSSYGALKIVFSMAFSKFFVFIFEFGIYFAAALSVFGISLHANIFDLTVVLILSSIAFCGVGLISGSMIMCYKKGDPFNWLISITFDLLSGVYFSTDILPAILRKASVFVPTTYALKLWREALWDGGIKYDINFIIFLIAALLLIAAGVWSFGYFFNRTRMKGDLAGY